MTKGLNTRHNIEVTVLSPLNIGAGAEKDLVKGVDFVEHDRKIHILSLKKMLQYGVNSDELSAYFAKKNHDGLLQKIKGKLNEITDAVFDLPASSTNDIKSFLKNQLTGKPIIAGSSLKGSVRSVILNYLLDGKKPRSLNEKDYFGDSKNGDELMRFIKFTDAEFEKTELVNTKIFNLYRNTNNWQGGWKKSGHETKSKYEAVGFNTIYECLMPNEAGLCSIMISDKRLFDEIEKTVVSDLKSEIRSYETQTDSNSMKKLKEAQNYLQKKEITNPLKKDVFNIYNLFSIINEHTEKYIDKEIAFFKKYSTDNTDAIIESLYSIKKELTSNNESCVLKMSAGSGAHSITGDIWHDDYTVPSFFKKGNKVNEQAPKSRKIAIYGDNNRNFTLMGFVKLSVISDEEIQKRLNAEKEEKERIEKAKQEEKELRIKEEAERKRRLEDFEKLISAASSLFDEGKLEEAKIEITKACEIIPNDSKCNNLLSRIEERLLEIKEQRKNKATILENKKQFEADRLAANQVPLIEKIKSVNKIPTLAGNIKTWMKLNNVQTLTDDDITVVKAKVQEIYNSLRSGEKRKFTLKPLEDIIDTESFTFDK